MGLPHAGDVIVLAFDGQQSHIANGVRIDRVVRCVISPFGRACLMNTVSTVWR